MTQQNRRLLGLLLISAFVLMGVAYYWGYRTTPPSKLKLTAEGYRSEFIAMHETEARGEARIKPGDTGFVVIVDLKKLKPHRRYNTHYHKGTCDRTGGGGLQLDPVKSDGTGSGRSRTRIRYRSINPTFDHLIMVHAPDQEHLLCADTPSIQRLRSVRIK